MRLYTPATLYTIPTQRPNCYQIKEKIQQVDYTQRSVSLGQGLSTSCCVHNEGKLNMSDVFDAIVLSCHLQLSLLETYGSYFL